MVSTVGPVRLDGEHERDVEWTVADLVELMHLGAYRDKYISELSTGTRRMVDLAMSIAEHPAVLLLDEPSAGIAQRETEALGPLLERIQRETNCARQGRAMRRGAVAPSVGYSILGDASSSELGGLGRFSKLRRDRAPRL